MLGISGRNGAMLVEERNTGPTRRDDLTHRGGHGHQRLGRREPEAAQRLEVLDGQGH
jgi:hypothetical protein